MFGDPFQYTSSKILLTQLENVQDTFQIKERDFLTFDALRQAAQCVGRVIRSKADYGMMIFTDKRYGGHDKHSKLPSCILSYLRDAHLNLSTNMVVHMARELRSPTLLKSSTASTPAKSRGCFLGENTLTLKSAILSVLEREALKE
ncbi:hypothetical protein SLEP1_g36934 [Rubroshorea leprosula]|uniref:ATP-dependent helicase C-terminal domain-containing protein n=1 Tax=Rubroshorea leprosula TaxID=152421 RepID=A0AAV5KT54_9ROSI|nr:hypothetical protein SLEP1_g36934 [Rubroshorea leprosula]